MGLDTTHNAFHGPYSSFGQFRTKLAEHIGITLADMEGFGGNKSFDMVEDDVKILLDHSDCDGEISPADCAKLSKRLDEILKELEPTDNWFSLYNFVKTFSEGCKTAAANNEPIEFH